VTAAHLWFQPLLSPEGWAYASMPPAEAGDPWTVGAAWALAVQWDGRVPPNPGLV
jgi:hypothetical protein